MQKSFSLKMVCVVGCWVGGDSMPCVFDDDDDYINVVGCYPACLMMMSLPRTATPHLGGPPTDVFASDLMVIMVMMIVLMMVTMVIVVLCIFISIFQFLMDWIEVEHG